VPRDAALAQQAGLAVGAFDADIAVPEGLRKFVVQELLEFGHAHFRCCHTVPALASDRLLH